MQNELIKFKKFVPLLSELVMRDIKVKYRRSVLALLFQPLARPLQLLALRLFWRNISNKTLASATRCCHKA